MKKIFSVLLVSSIFTSEAHALSAVSRACSFVTIPKALQVSAIPFFIALGADNSIRDLDLASTGKQASYWINESFTVDYFSVRYYLYAQAVVYALKADNSPTPGQWVFSNVYSSDGWAPGVVSKEIQSDPRWATFFANRGPFYSVRAGNPKIGEFQNNIYDVRFSVTGFHYYYDPVAKVQGKMVTTRATDCNLQQWGKGTGQWDR